jgi:hypothetical protein
MLSVIVGGFISTGIISRPLLWLLGWWSDQAVIEHDQVEQKEPVGRIWLANIASGLVAFGIAGLSFAGPNETFSASSGAAYFIPQAMWL